MSNRSFIKGLKRKARGAGFGRGCGDVQALLADQSRREVNRLTEVVRRAQTIAPNSRLVASEAERLLARESERDQKRSSRKGRGSK